MNVLFEWIVAIHYNAFVTVKDFVVSQIGIVISAIGWFWISVLVYQDKERYARPKRRFI